jgi:NADPH-dependent curcumin reductase CurA
MSQCSTVNRKVVLAARPRGAPTPEDFRLDQGPVPEPGAGEVLLRTLYLSLDPYMREVMDEVAPIYATSIPLGEPMVGATVNRVVASDNPKFRAGDLVAGNAGWQDFAISDGEELTPLNESEHPSYALSILGMPAFTAYVGTLDIGRPQPGETLVVGAATGAVGSVVGQIAKLQGARVVGIAGGPEKCRHAVEELGFDACVDHRDPRMAELLGAACPDGIDVYFENVGGRVFDAVLPLLNLEARVPLCGFISHYNESASDRGPDRLRRSLQVIHQKRVLVKGLIILDYYDTRHEAFLRDMNAWLAGGEVKPGEHLIEGLENAPSGLIAMLEGGNFGKTLVEVAAE